MMGTDMAQRFFRSSRISQAEEKRNIRKASVYIGLSVIILLLFMFQGVPLLARFAVFLGENGKQDSSLTDDLPPAPPRLSPLADVVRTELVSVRGFTESGVDVDLYLNDSKIKETLADDSGEFLFSDVKIASGSNQLYVMARDKDKNQSQPSGVIRISLDQIPPTLKVTSPKDGTVFSGQSNKNVQIVGEAEEESDVKINGRSAIIGAGGKFEITHQLADGDQEIKIEAVDAAGNKTEVVLDIKFNP